MVVASVVFCFLLAVAGAWILAFPGARDALAGIFVLSGRRLCAAFQRAGESGRRLGMAVGRRTASAARLGAAQARLRLHILAVAAALLCLPTLILFVAGSPNFHGFDLGTRSVNSQIANLLEGEHLVPPPPLPPAVFASQDLVAERPMLLSANRNWELLDADFARRLLLAFRIMRESHGYEMVIIEGYRTPQRQTMLASLGPHVTSAKAFQSYHQFGLAADSAFLRDGRLVISEADPWAMRGYRLFGEVAESLGLHWGGRWNLRDFGHVELRKGK